MAIQPNTSQHHETHKINSEIDAMDGYSFESYCADLLRANGFLDVETTKKSGDRGVDITCMKDAKKYAIQCKRFSTKVSRQAVQEIHAGKALYKCDVGVILTNSDFTSGAIDDAKDLEIELWGSDKFRELNKAMDNYSAYESAGPFITILAWIILIAVITLAALASIHSELILQFIESITVGSAVSLMLGSPLAAAIAGITAITIIGFILYVLVKIFRILEKYFVFILILILVLFAYFLWNVVSPFFI